MKYLILLFVLSLTFTAFGQPSIKITDNLSSKANVYNSKNTLAIEWDAGANSTASIHLNLTQNTPLIKLLQLKKTGVTKTIGLDLEPGFILTVGERNLKRNKWVVFFDQVHERKYLSRAMKLNMESVIVSSEGSRTVIKISEVSFKEFVGYLEITLFNGSPLIKVTAVVKTNEDGKAILYDAGLVSAKNQWTTVSWIETDGQFRNSPLLDLGSKNLEVRHRTIIGEQESGTIAVFPPPHQYFYPLDEAFNHEFVWHGNYYRDHFEGYGIGIRQDPIANDQSTPWFNAPPDTEQKLSFFFLISDTSAQSTIEEVKKFTHGDRYPEVNGFKTFSSHFHNEFIMKVVLAEKPVPVTPEFVTVFKSLGVDIVHLGEFHVIGHPKGPDSLRLKELKNLFDQCKRLSDDEFLLLPGEEPNLFFGGHWMQIFPNPVYWVMDRPDNISFLRNDPEYGKVYHVGSSAEMLKLLELEKGLAWTAHPRIKGSLGYPDKYKLEEFYQSDQFLGAAWKSMPADLSYDHLGARVLDLFNDMNNWGQPKRVISEADLFTITQENEMWAHMNTNYLMINELPDFSNGWSNVLEALSKGRYFSTTGEIIIPNFTANGKGLGELSTLQKNGNVDIQFRVNWTFPLSYAVIISGDGKEIFSDRINLNHTTPFGDQVFKKTINLAGRKWVRLEVWDTAVNGAFTQAIAIK